MTKSTRNLLIGGAVVAAAAGGLAFYEHQKHKTAVPAGQLPAGTPVTSFTTGTKYSFAAMIPSGIGDTAALQAALTTAGWQNANVIWFAGNGTSTGPFPTPNTNGYVATGTWNGAANAPVPSGVVAVVIA
jgi:hypothetical protein